MPIIEHEAVVYVPPKSTGFGHQARIRNGRRAWAATRLFLETHTRYAFQPWVELQIIGDPNIDPKICRERRKAAEELFGIPIARSTTTNRSVRLSDLRGWRSGSSLHGVHFQLPTYPRPTIELHLFLTELDDALPFRLRDNYFQRMLPSPKGGWGQTRRLPKGWRRAA